MALCPLWLFPSPIALPWTCFQPPPLPLRQQAQSYLRNSDLPGSPLLGTLTLYPYVDVSFLSFKSQLKYHLSEQLSLTSLILPTLPPPFPKSFSERILFLYCCCSVAKLYLTLPPHRLQNARLLYPPLSPRVGSNSCPLSQWYYLTMSPSVFPFFSCPQSFQASGSFPMSRLLTVLEYCASVLELQFHHQSFQWIFRVDFSFRIDWFDLLAAQGTLKNLLQHHSSKASILWCSVFFMAQLSHLYMTTGKTIALTISTFVGKVMSAVLYWVGQKVYSGFSISVRQKTWNELFGQADTGLKLISPADMSVLRELGNIPLHGRFPYVLKWLVSNNLCVKFFFNSVESL